MVDVEHVAIAGDLESRRRLLLSHVFQGDGVVGGRGLGVVAAEAVAALLLAGMAAKAAALAMARVTGEAGQQRISQSACGSTSRRLS